MPKVSCNDCKFNQIKDIIQNTKPWAETGAYCQKKQSQFINKRNVKHHCPEFEASGSELLFFGQGVYPGLNRPE